MIKISSIEKELQEYQPCMSCGTKEGVKEVNFGIKEVKNSIRLCNNCIIEIGVKNRNFLINADKINYSK